MKRIVMFFTLLLLAFGGYKALAQESVLADPQPENLPSSSPTGTEEKKDWGSIYVEASLLYSMGDVTGNGVFSNVSVKYRIPQTAGLVYLSWGGTNKEMKSGYPQMYTVMAGVGTDVLRFKKSDFSIEPMAGIGFATGGFGSPERSYSFALEVGAMFKYDLDWCYFGFQNKVLVTGMKWNETGCLYDFMTGFTYGVRF